MIVEFKLPRHQPRTQDKTMPHTNANPKHIPAIVPVKWDLGSTAKMTPTTKKPAAIEPSTGPQYHAERDADTLPTGMGVDSYTYIHQYRQCN